MNIVEQLKSVVKKQMEYNSSCHDWWHTLRVYNNALKIAKKEKSIDLLVVELASLLHDVDDWKFNDGDFGSKSARKILISLSVDKRVIEQVCQIIDEISFKGANVKSSCSTIESKIVQDADRLDALGAIGIARAFTYGGYKKREIYNPNVKPVLHKSFVEYKNNNSNTINHFYEKLLLLKDLMNTEAARKMAVKRHNFMEKYLSEFLKECGDLG